MIAIIGILVALLLPAIQAARESARLVQCKNNLRQIGLAVLGYETSQRAFPSGGWGSEWTGDPNVGTGPRQPGGWIYQSLPYLEQQSIANLGFGLRGDALKTALTEQCQAAISVFYCPSRRAAQPYGAVTGTSWNYYPLQSAAKTDYAANGGSRISITGKRAPLPQLPFVVSDCSGGYPHCEWMNVQQWIELLWNGIIIDHISLRLVEVTDGTSSTLLAGEKWLYQLYYDSTTIDASFDNQLNQYAADNPGDDGSMYAGYDFDNVRACGYTSNANNSLPKRDSEYDIRNNQSDKKGAHYKERFGGPHPAGFNIVRCDGSVDTLSFDLDPLVWGHLGPRNDGEVQ